MGEYDEEYYQGNGQLQDRPALGFYVRLVQRYLGEGMCLDFGCGTGHLLRRLRARGPASGFETSAFSAERARESAPGCTVTTSMDELQDRSFRALTAIHVVEHLDDTTAESVVQTWRRVLDD